MPQKVCCAPHEADPNQQKMLRLLDMHILKVLLASGKSRVQDNTWLAKPDKKQDVRHWCRDYGVALFYLNDLKYIMQYK